MSAPDLVEVYRRIGVRHPLGARGNCRVGSPSSNRPRLGCDTAE